MAELVDRICAGDISPVYHLSGEAYQRDRVVAALRRAVVVGDAGAFNLDLLQAKDSGSAGILLAVRTLPMLGDRRLVVVRDADELSAEQLKSLIPYVEHPSPQSVLVLIATKADLRQKFFTVLKRKGVVHRFEPLKERQVPTWLAAEARRGGIRLQAGAAERIADAVGTDMAQLVDALERLSLYVGSGAPIAVSDVEEMLAQTRQRSIFELTNAVGQGRRRDAMLVLHQMLQAREPALRIVAMLTRHIRQLWSARELEAAGYSSNDIASRLGIHPYFLTDLLRQAHRFDAFKLRKTHRALFELDRSLKSSPLAEGVLLDLLVLRLCDEPDNS